MVSNWGGRREGMGHLRSLGTVGLPQEAPRAHTVTQRPQGPGRVSECGFLFTAVGRLGRGIEKCGGPK